MPWIRINQRPLHFRWPVPPGGDGGRTAAGDGGCVEEEDDSAVAVDTVGAAEVGPDVGHFLHQLLCHQAKIESLY